MSTNNGCDIYFDTDTELENLSKSIAEYFSLPINLLEIQGEDFGIFINKNNDFDPEKRYENFLHFKYLMEITVGEGKPFRSFKDLISKILEFLWNRKIPAVAACDFEDALPRKGSKLFFAP